MVCHCAAVRSTGSVTHAITALLGCELAQLHCPSSYGGSCTCSMHPAARRPSYPEPARSGQQAAEHAGSSRRGSSLPRATPAEIAEAHRAAGGSQPGSPASPAAAAAAAAVQGAEAEDKKAAAAEEAAAVEAPTSATPQTPSEPSEISLTLKGWAAANAVRAK